MPLCNFNPRNVQGFEIQYLWDRRSSVFEFVQLIDNRKRCAHFVQVLRLIGTEQSNRLRIVHVKLVVCILFREHRQPRSQYFRGSLYQQITRFHHRQPKKLLVTITPAIRHRVLAPKQHPIVGDSSCSIACFKWNHHQLVFRNYSPKWSWIIVLVYTKQITKYWFISFIYGKMVRN